MIYVNKLSILRMFTFVKFLGFFIEQSIKGKLPKNSIKKTQKDEVRCISKKTGKRLKYKVS